MTDVTLQNYPVPTLPQLGGGDQVFWRNELQKISKSINLLVKQLTTVTSEVNTLISEMSLVLAPPTFVGDIDYQMLASDRLVGSGGSATANHTWTLPASLSVAPNTRIVIFNWGHGAHTITIAAHGSEQISNPFAAGAPANSASVTSAGTTWLVAEFVLWAPSTTGATWLLTNWLDK